MFRGWNVCLKATLFVLIATWMWIHDASKPLERVSNVFRGRNCMFRKCNFMIRGRNLCFKAIIFVLRLSRWQTVMWIQDASMPLEHVSNTFEGETLCFEEVPLCIESETFCFVDETLCLEGEIYVSRVILFALMTTWMWIQDASKSLEHVSNAFEGETLCFEDVPLCFESETFCFVDETLCFEDEIYGSRRNFLIWWQPECKCMMPRRLSSTFRMRLKAKLLATWMKIHDASKALEHVSNVFDGETLCFEGVTSCLEGKIYVSRAILYVSKT